MATLGARLAGTAGCRGEARGARTRCIAARADHGAVAGWSPCSAPGSPGALFRSRHRRAGAAGRRRGHRGPPQPLHRRVQRGGLREARHLPHPGAGLPRQPGHRRRWSTGSPPRSAAAPAGCAGCRPASCARTPCPCSPARCSWSAAFLALQMGWLCVTMSRLPVPVRADRGAAGRRPGRGVPARGPSPSWPSGSRSAGRSPSWRSRSSCGSRSRPAATGSSSASPTRGSRRGASASPSPPTASRWSC